MNRCLLSLLCRTLSALGLALPVVAGVGCSDSSSEDPPDLPDVDGWAPEGARTVGTYGYEIIPEPNGFHTMHVGPNNSDNVWVATAPMLELDWVAEEGFYVPEGPTYDNQGNLYFSPIFPKEDVQLVSLDAETGERNWAIRGDGVNVGSGAILILNDPDDEGEQIIYQASYTEAMALRPDGSEIWRQPTGLTLPEVEQGVPIMVHSFGANYHPQSDSIVALMMDGAIVAFDRTTGAPIAPIGQIPGSPAADDGGFPPAFIIEASNALTDEVFGKMPNGESIYERMINVIFGGGSIISNYFAIDPNTGVIYVAATAEDGADETVDGISELGALYSFQLRDDGSGSFEFELLNMATFQGGTGSTPTVSEDGSKVVVSDNQGNVITLDSELNELWRLNLGANVAASVAVSPDNNELFAVTQRDVFKLTDNGDSGSLDWTADLHVFADDENIDAVFQALTPTITANGIAVSVGGGKSIAGREVMLRVGVGILDRITGELVAFNEGREDSVAVTSVAPDGGIYTAGSPVRRVSGKALFPALTGDLIGGISRYKPVRNDLLVRDATCAAGLRAKNAAGIADSAPQSAAQDVRQIKALITQSRNALDRAVADGDLDSADAIRNWLDAADDELDSARFLYAAANLLNICTYVDAPAP